MATLASRFFAVGCIDEADHHLIEAPVEVDIRMYALEKTDRLISEGHEVLCWAMKFGHVVYDRSNTWESLRRNWLHRLPMPPADEAGERAKKSLQVARDMLGAGDEDAADDLLLAALTQLVRAKLIRAGIFPASRPELPDQLRSVNPNDPLAELLDDAMFGGPSPRELLDRLDQVCHSSRETAD